MDATGDALFCFGFFHCRVGTHGVYLKDLEERKEQEAGNRRGIEQAANNLKVKCGLILYWEWECSCQTVTELQLLLQEEESLAKNFIDRKTQQALEAHDKKLESCQQKLATLDSFLHRIRQLQQHSDPVQLLEMKYTGIEKEMQEARHLLEHWHPVPFSFEHIRNHYKHFVTVLQSVLQKPLEGQLKEDVFSGLNATAKKDLGTVLKTLSPVDQLLFLKCKYG
ncbi:tripartite motif-containing protein 14 [Heliangelus exortis]|uniref:tripartite motif-containing protein 14 n=1 Tax=Heliangelus exortis TaxID=472823 RepID=UPI003A93FCF9